MTASHDQVERALNALFAASCVHGFQYHDRASEQGETMTTFKGFDVTAIHTIANETATVAADGYQFVAGYYFQTSGFKQQLDAASAQKLSAAGLSIVSVYENGSPINDNYFTVRGANNDAHVAYSRAVEAGQASGGIYAAYDYDPSQSAIEDILVPYATEFRRVLETLSGGSLLPGAYGSGALCSRLMELGLVHFGWLSQSTGFSGYQSYKPNAAIVQGHETTLFGCDVDLDTAQVADYGQWTV